MLKYISVAIFSILGFVGAEAYAAKTIKLAPQESKQLANNSFLTVNATCSIQGTKPGKIRVSILQNKGKVNGRSLSMGQATSMSVRNNQSISVTAEPGTKVNLINIGKEPVSAVCST
jgi:hypothetical protein